MLYHSLRGASYAGCDSPAVVGNANIAEETNTQMTYRLFLPASLCETLWLGSRITSAQIASGVPNVLLAPGCGQPNLGSLL